MTEGQIHEYCSCADTKSCCTSSQSSTQSLTHGKDPVGQQTVVIVRFFQQHVHQGVREFRSRPSDDQHSFLSVRVCVCVCVYACEPAVS